MKPKASKRRRDRPIAKSEGAGIPPVQQPLVAAIGASAGGIEAFTELIHNLPADTGMAFVFVQHLDPKHHSMLTELLSRKTTMAVEEVTDGMGVEPNHVYVIPPNATLSIADHTLHLGPREEERGLHMSIDRFMRSLAAEHGDRAIGVILSGSGTDGTLGMAEIQAHGGVTLAQDEASAKYDGMPRSAIGAGCVDYVLPPKGIARELARIARHPYVARDGHGHGHGHGQTLEVARADASGLNSVFQLLRKSTGVDFTHYRQTTVLRRIQRRMVVHKIDKMSEYVRLAKATPSEIKALYQDMLINVTCFFRTPKAFDALKTEVFPAVVNSRAPGSAVRVWTPACASGEETYSVAMALLEFLGDKAAQVPIQMFGTDVSENSIDKARSGVYPENIVGDVSPERLRRFFTKIEGGYRISKSVRDMCVFAQHNLLNDPPFSQMDLICCRNLLIYLEPVLQNKVLSLFHYATRPGGFLMLGTSEGAGTIGNLFTTVDRVQKVFRKKATAVRQPVSFSLNRVSERAEYGVVRTPLKQPDSTWNYLEAQKEFDRQLLKHHVPAAAFVNEELEVVHTRGSVNQYLTLAPGRASLSILKMAKEGLLLDLRSALGRAKKDNAAVQKRNVLLKNGNGDTQPGIHTARLVRFDVVPFDVGSLKERHFMIVFQDEAVEKGRERRPPSRSRASASGAARVARLEQELAAAKEYLQSVIETQEATNEELQSANEEILSSNEELQSTNEELETAKEELQSSNEELTTLNDELRSRNQEVTQANTDLTNLFASIDAAVVMVGSDLTIRRFTPEAPRFLGLIPADLGRPLINIRPVIEIPDFHALVVEVMSSQKTMERKLADAKGRRYQLRILPYRTLDNKVDGAVITIIGSSDEEQRGAGANQA